MVADDFKGYSGDPHAGNKPQTEDWIMLFEARKSFAQKRRLRAYIRQDGPPMIPRAYSMLNTQYEVEPHLLKPHVAGTELPTLGGSIYQKKHHVEQLNRFMHKYAHELEDRKSRLSGKRTIESYDALIDYHPKSPHQQYQDQIAQHMNQNLATMKAVTQPNARPIKFTF
jgi:hypothetical protein